MSLQTESAGSPQLTGARLWLTAVVLAATNFIAILDLTIANVSVANIAGSLGATVAQGAWVITSYAVAEAITVPLTGWLAARFGPVRTFVAAVGGFAIFSAVCGMSNSLGMLVLGRILLGFSGGPIIPVSQTLLLKIFPKDMGHIALGLSTISMLVAPIFGPFLGGYLCDNFGWPWVFLINIPIAAICMALAWRLLRGHEEPVRRMPIDRTGLALLVVWVGALQIMLDEGKDLDWFASPLIAGLAVVALMGFVAFVIWELHEEHPVVDLRVFRYRGFSVPMVILVIGGGAMFGCNVLTPLWLQYLMGYTATWSGEALGWMGLTAVIVTPGAAIFASRADPRWVTFAGLAWIGVVTLWRSIANTDMDYPLVSIALALMGLGLPTYMIAIQGIALGSVAEEEIATAAGLLNFLRTLSSAIATSLVVTSWEVFGRFDHVELVGAIDWRLGMHEISKASDMAPDVVLEGIDGLVTAQSVMLATNEVMTLLGIAMLVAAGLVFLAPRPLRALNPASAGH